MSDLLLAALMHSLARQHRLHALADKRLAMRRIASLLALSVVLIACGTSKETTSDGVSANQIDVRELPPSAEMFSAYDIIRRHKSNWLRKRGTSSMSKPTPIKVYLDNTGSPYGGIGSLREIKAREVATIEYFGPGDAQLKFGLGNRSGAILLHTRGSDK